MWSCIPQYRSLKEALGLPNVCQEDVTLAEVNEAILCNHLQNLKEGMEKMEKLTRLKETDMRRCQDYMSSYSLEYSRIAFRVQTRMIVCRANMKNKYDGDLTCRACTHGGDGPVESQEHMKVCPAYESFQRHQDIDGSKKEEIEFFGKVIKARVRKKIK